MKYTFRTDLQAKKLEFCDLLSYISLMHGALTLVMTLMLYIHTDTLGLRLFQSQVESAKSPHSFAFRKSHLPAWDSVPKLTHKLRSMTSRNQVITWYCKMLIQAFPAYRPGNSTELMLMEWCDTTTRLQVSNGVLRLK